MLKKTLSCFNAICDVCGTSEEVDAKDHAKAWEVLKQRAWAVRRKAFPIIHICPECPVEVGQRVA